jgi:hypothetical protein
VARIGVANVNRGQLDEALALAPITAVQIALSPYDDAALRGGVVERCVEAGLAVIAHSPLGGPRRAARLARDPALGQVAAAHGAMPADAALAWLLALHPSIVAIPGARRPETARAAAAATRLRLDDGDRAALPARLRGTGGGLARAGEPAAGVGEVVLIMGIPGAGKSEAVEDYVARGYRRLNRDELGGTLQSVARALDEELARGARRVALDNTYLTRAARSHVLDAAARHGLAVRCVWLDTPLAQAQVNLVERLLDRYGTLPGPAELRKLARAEPGVLAPASQMRTLRELEPPAADEGFDAVEIVPFARKPRRGPGRAGVFIARGALADGWETALAAGAPADPRLVFDWSADGVARGLDELAARLAAEVEGPVETAFCPHGGGPPVCWCRPPLPGLPLAFARAHDVDPARSFVVGTGPAHRALAEALGARYVAAGDG